MSLIKSECRKFSPNIFNKSKCQNCFASKDSHSAEALDNNRVSRKVSKCGYLFVAPDWDFSDPINRTKRWQRRWFVLFDDGELTYSVDEHPETVPQAIIDMTKVIEVSNGEDVTGNQFAIAIIAPEKVHFVKGTSREESKWWFDVLAIFPRSIKGTRHKRNATFPGGKASTIVNRPTEELNIQESVKSESNHLENNQNVTGTSNKDVTNIVSVNNRKNSAISGPSTRNEQIRTRRISKRGAPIPRSLSDGVSLMIPKKHDIQSTTSEKKRNAYIVTVNDSNEKSSSSLPYHQCNDKTNGLSGDSSSTTEQRDVNEFERFIPIPRLIDPSEKVTLSKQQSDSNLETRRICELIDLPDSNNVKEQFNVRGDPDGCGLELKTNHYSVVDPIEGNLKKGWLLKYDSANAQEWTKVWCVLGTSSLEYYDDCSDEVNGVMLGVIPLNLVSSVQKLFIDGHHSFQLSTRNGDVQLFAAITVGIRASWISALRSAVVFPREGSASEPPISLGEKIEQEMSLNNDISNDGQQEPQRVSVDIPSSPRSGFSSDDEFKTASEASGRTEDYFEWADEDVDQSSSSRALPPSPPLNRTPMSRVKERAKTRSSSRSGTHCEKQDGSKKSLKINKEDASKDDLSGSDREMYLTPKLRRRSSSRNRRDSNCTASDVPESMMVELLEAEVESLKSQLERCQQEVVELQRNNVLKSQRIIGLDNQGTKCNFESEPEMWQKRHADLLCRYHGLKKRNEIFEHTNVVSEREKLLLAMCETLEEKFRTEKLKWEHERRMLENDRKEKRCSHQETIEGLEERVKRSETNVLKLTEDIENLNRTRLENDIQNESKEMHEKNSVFPNTDNNKNVDNVKSNSWCMDSLSDLSDVSFLDNPEFKGKEALVDELQKRLRKTVAEIKVLKREVRHAHASSDKHELRNLELERAMELAKEDHGAQMKMMTQRIEDLTGKLSNAEKQNRQLRQKMTRSENKEQKRTRSLKGKEMSTITKELEAKVGELEKKLSSVENICALEITPTDQIEKSGLSSSNLESSVELLVRINALDSKMEMAASKLTELKKEKKKDVREDLNVSSSKFDVSSPHSLVRQFNQMLAKKSSFFKEKESMLAQLGLLNKKTQTKINLEKIVHEANLIGQIGGILRTTTKEDVVRKECRRLRQQLSLFEKKLCRLDGKNVAERKEEATNETFDVTELVSFSKKVNEMTISYKNNQLDLLASALARKTVGKNLEETKGSKVDILSQKLTEVELKRIVSSLSHLRQEEEELAYFDVTSMPSRLRDEIHTRLQQDVDSVIDELQTRFRRVIANCQNIESSDLIKNSVDSQLAEFADVIAHNSILMSRVDFVNNLNPTYNCKVLKDEDVALTKLADQILDKEYDLIHVDVDKCAAILGADWRHRSSEASIEFPLSRTWTVQDILTTAQDGKPSLFLNSYQERAQRSFRQRGKRSVTMPIFCPIEEAKSKEVKCAQCQELTKKVEEQSKKEEEIKLQLKQLERQLVVTEQKLVAKEEESKQQIAALKETYAQDDTNRNNTINEETIRQKYQAETEQLRGLCEKGLLAMENSHRRIIAELEEKHNREMEQLQVEKEQALAEETQATLAALDAMRKAHEAELQREIAKFKEEFLEKMQSTHELDVMQKEQEAEIETIKEGILSLSEKYSIKCLENASLEERLKPLLQQLTDANELAFDLTARNKQLRALLNMNNAELTSIADSTSSSHEANLCRLKVRENVMTEKNEEIADLKRQLREARRHKSDLDSRCRQLDQSLKAERRLREDEVSSLRDRLEHIILTSNASLEVLTMTRMHVASFLFPSSSTTSAESCNLPVACQPAVASSKLQVEPVNSDPKPRRFSSFLRGRELMRSPSCPGLNNETCSEMFNRVDSAVLSTKKRLFEPGKSFC